MAVFRLVKGDFSKRVFIALGQVWVRTVTGGILRYSRLPASVAPNE